MHYCDVSLDLIDFKIADETLLTEANCLACFNNSMASLDSKNSLYRIRNSLCKSHFSCSCFIDLIIAISYKWNYKEAMPG